MTGPDAIQMTLEQIDLAAEVGDITWVDLNFPFSPGVSLDDVKAKLAGSFIDPMPGGPQAFSKFLTEEIARWQSVVKQAGITVTS